MNLLLTKSLYLSLVWDTPDLRSPHYGSDCCEWREIFEFLNDLLIEKKKKKKGFLFIIKSFDVPVVLIRKVGA